MQKGNTLKKVELEQQEFWESTRVAPPFKNRKKYRRKEKYKPNYEHRRD